MKNTFSLVKIAATAAAGIMAFTLAAPVAHAQVTFGIRLGQPPPPLRYEARPHAPGPGYVWSEGYWEPFQGRYRWDQGYWNRPPFEGAFYVHPHWDHYPDGWHMHEGYWSREDHDNHYWDNRQGDRRDDHRDDHRDDRRDPR